MSESGIWKSRLVEFCRKEFGGREPTRARDLVIFPLGISATAGLILGVWSEAHRHFLDPPFIAYSVAVDVCVQIVILILALAIAFIARRKLWSGILLAILFFCLLAIPGLVKVILPGVAHWLVWLIALLGAFQITRSVNSHRHSRAGAWMIAVPILVALCALSYGRAREISMRSALPNPPNSPNVLVIIVDSLRADHLSPYGYSRDTSPYVNQLAQQGVLFENAVAPSSWTLPSHASMLTGLYPHEAHVELEKDDLSANLPTLGEAMGKAGYRTAAFSANYFMFSRDHGFMHGFSHFEGYEQSAAGILEKIPLSEFIFTKLSHLTTGVAGAFFGLKNAAGADKISEDALDWIAQGRRPFFVVLNYFDVHDPVMPPATYQHIYTTNADARNQSMHFEENCDSEKALCNKERQQFIDTYDGSMRFVDDSVRHLLSQLNQLGMLQNTIVVFTSDHGQEFGDHGFFGHEKSLYRQEIQVPLIVWRPGSIPASVRITTPVSLTDLPATVLDLVSPEQMKTLPGRSLAELWRSSEPASEWHNPMPELARLHWFDKDAPNYNGPVRSIVTPDWQYIRQQGKDLLFDWKADPAEANDLCASQPVVCADLRTQLQSEEAGHQ